MKDAVIHIGDTGDLMGQRFIDAFHRAARGDATPADPVVVFEDWQTFVATFSKVRIAMLKHLSATGGTDSINALAGSLGRPYRRVHDDVMALLDAGLLERDGTRIMPVAGGAVARIDFFAQAS